jgi:hypothetical protein
MTSKPIHKILFLLLAFTVCILPASAEINVTMTNHGTSFIEWGWDSWVDAQDIFIDGYKVCGYESTIPDLTVTDVHSGSCHNITVFDVGGIENGTNVACAMSSNASRGGSVTTGNSDMMSTSNIMFGLIGGLVGAVILLGIFYKRK